MKNFIKSCLIKFLIKKKNLIVISEYSSDKMKSIKRNIIYQLLANPNLYLKMLLLRSLAIGAVTLGIWFIVKFFGLEAYTIPSAMHSLIGIVIGLLLVFRTNTAYDRWWDGRKIIASLASEVSIVTARLNVCPSQTNDAFYVYNVDSIKNEIKLFLTGLRDYLTTGEEDVESNEFHINQKNSFENLLKHIRGIDIDDHTRNLLINSLCRMMEYSNQLERIKNTPIPLSYVFHIKISVLIYMFTLPFGMFHDLGVGAVPLVMLIYYIIAGVEIISSEIENPFAGDPNDLPTNKYFNTILQTLNT